MTPEQELVAHYQSLGLRLLYWERKGTDPKGWKGPTDKGWNDPSRTYDLSRYDPTIHNLGVFTGCEVSPGKYLADGDLDWAPGLELATKLLPQTGFGFGRKGKKLSHVLYTTPTPVDYLKYTDWADEEKGTGEGVTFIELRGGHFTHQTMIAPSLHSFDVRIEQVLRGDLPHVEVARLQEAFLNYAIGCLLLHRIPGGLHHEGRIALAGLLLRAGFTPERIIAIGEAVCARQVALGVPEMSSKDVGDVTLVVRSTAARLEEGKKTAGGPKLAEFVGGKAGKFLVAKIRKWLGKDEDFIRSKGGLPIGKCVANVERALDTLDARLTYDEFSERLLLNSEVVTDIDLSKLKLQCEREFGLQVPTDYFYEVARDLAWQNRFHPVRDYLATLTWDGIARIDTWLTVAAGCEDTEYTRAVSAIVLTAAVKRALEPGCKYDEMLVLVSDQGYLKSTMVAALCPRPEWFSDTFPLNIESKELIEATLGKWILEAGDLAGKRKTEIDNLKASLSRQVDGPVRMAYARVPVERRRAFIVIGTTNKHVFLFDSTGGRRFWPADVRTVCDVRWVAAHRDQLWAEALARVKAGCSIRLPERLWPAAADEQEKRREIDPWEHGIHEGLLKLEPGVGGLIRLPVEEAYAMTAVPMSHRDRTFASRVSDIMQRYGFERTNVRNAEGQSVKGFKQMIGKTHLLTADAEEGEGTAVEVADDVPF